MFEAIRSWGHERLGQFARVFFAVTLVVSLTPIAPRVAAAEEASDTTAPEMQQTSGTDPTAVESEQVGVTGAEESATPAQDEQLTAASVEDQAEDDSEIIEAIPTEETETLDADADVWDGAIDVSWYNTTDTTFTLTKPAQLAGLAAITSPKSFDNWEAGTKDSRADGIKVDNFAGKTIVLGADIDLNGFTSAGGENMLWLPISDMNNWGAGGQGTSNGTYDGLCWQGTFDGNGHVVKNMRIDGNVWCSTNYGGYQGFISAIGIGGVVKNLGVTGTIKARVAGGIVGASNTKQEDTLTTDIVSWPRVMNCWSNVTITGNGSSSRGCAGIFGGESNNRAMCNVINCYAMGAVSNNQAAGVSGSTNGVVGGCYNLGNVTGGYMGSVVSTLYLKSAVSDTFKGVGMFVNNMALSGTNANFYRYCDTATGNPIEVTEGFSTSDELKAGASTLGNGYVADSSNINNGYPILFWQAGLSEISIDGATIDAIEPVPYTGKSVEPALTVKKDGVTLVEGVDYLVQYANNVETGTDTASATVYGVGRYTGSLAAVNFSITMIDLSTCTIDPIPNQWYYGEPVTPLLTVKDAEGNVLTLNKDYAVDYADNDAAGKATATIRSTGSGAVGTKSADFYLTAASTQLSGEGTEANPYLITSKADLQFLSKRVYEGDEAYAKASYKLANDVDTTCTSETEAAFEQIGAARYYDEEGKYTVVNNYFCGTFDGDGHTITLDMQRSTISPSNTGLFAYVGDGSKTYPVVTIKNLTVDGQIAGYAIGAIVGSAFNATLHVENCTNKAKLTSSYALSSGSVIASSAAGIVNSMSFGYIKNCTNEGTIYGSPAAGILQAQNTTSLPNAATTPVVISDCMNYGDISTEALTTTKCTNLAGIVSLSQLQSPLTIARCGNEGAIGNSTGQTAAGILAKGDATGGIRKLTLDSCYNFGSVSTSTRAGGIVGSLGYGEQNILNCYNAGTITEFGTSTSNYVGGLVGCDAGGSSTKGDHLITGYNCGTIVCDSSSPRRGAVIGYINVGGNNNVRTTNVKSGYLDSVATSAVGYLGTSKYMVVNDEATAYTEEELKALPSGLGVAFVSDETPSINSGYPVLYWQTDAGALDIGLATAEEIPNKTYTGSAIEPQVSVSLSGEELKEGLDYTLRYENNINAGTASAVIEGMGRYAGTEKLIDFIIEPKAISDCDMEDIADSWCAGEAIPACPDIALKDGTKSLVRGSDFTVAYSGNTAEGEATAIVAGIGNYEGQLSATFKVYEASTELEGSGNAVDPYLISSKEDLEFLALAVNNSVVKYRYAAYKVTDDIDASDADGRIAVDVIGLPGSVAGKSTVFCGIFDGDGHTITLGLSKSQAYKGLFGVAADCTICNVTTAGIVENAPTNAGGIAGILTGKSTVQNCTNKATISGATCGGIAGQAYATGDVSFENCVNLGSVSGTNSIGGILGTLYMPSSSTSTASTGDVGAVKIDNCFNYADVTNSGTGATLIAGGIMGYCGTYLSTGILPPSDKSWSIDITACGNTGDITGNGYAGGIMGRMYSFGTTVSLTDVYNTGDLKVTRASSNSATNYAGVGGIISQLGDPTNTTSIAITNAYNAGSISSVGGKAGGVIGSQRYSGNYATIENVYYSDSVSAAVGYASNADAISDSSTAVSDDELKALGAEGMAAKLGASFADDTSAVNGGYPVLGESIDAAVSEDIADCIVKVVPSQTYTGSAITPEIKVLNAAGSLLEQGVDYDVAFSDNAEAGVAEALIIGIGSYTGYQTMPFEIKQASLASCTIAPVEDQVATGSPLMPELSIVNAEGVELVAGTDYDAYYFNNISQGTARVSVLAKGNYAGQKSFTFKIVAGNIADATITGIEDSYSYTGEAVELNPMIVLGEQTLLPGVDYLMEIKDASGKVVSEIKDKGEYTVTLTGAGVYTGAVVKNVSVGTYFTVYTQVGPEGEPTVAKEYTKAQFEALAVDGDPAVSMLYSKSNVWNVLSSDNYVKVSTLLADAGIADQFVDGTSLVIGEFGGFTSTGTWAEYRSQVNFYPGLKADSTGLENPRSEEAVLALTLGKSSFTEGTAGDAETANLAAQSTAGAPRLLRGVSEDQVTGEKKAAGNRSPSGCNSVTLVLPEPVFFTLYMQEGESGEPQVVKEYTRSELEGLVSDSEDPVSGLFFKSNVWNVVTAATYVTLEDLVADAGIADLWGEGSSLSYGGDPAQNKAGQVFSYEELNAMSNFYPSAVGNLSDASESAPAPVVLSLSECSSATSLGVTAADAQEYNVAHANTINTPRIVYGVSEAAFLAQDSVEGQGNIAGIRYWSKNESLTIIVPETTPAELAGEWVQDDNGWQYRYDEVSAAAAGKEFPVDEWAQIDGSWYHFDSEGYRQVRWFLASVDINGDETPGTDGSGAWYFADEEGKLQIGGWHKDSVGWCYTDDETGEMWFSRWTRDSSGPCYIGSQGYCLTGWFRVDTNINGDETLGTDGLGAWYYADSNGCVKCGNWYKDSQGWCYTDPETGEMWANKWVKDSVAWCFIGSAGYCLTGQQTISVEDGQAGNPGAGTYLFASDGRLVG